MRRESILMVEDSQVTVKAMKRHFEIAGYRFDSAYDATTARHKIIEECPDVLILDLDLGKSESSIGLVPIETTEGFQLLEWIRENPESKTLRDLPVLVITYYDKREEEEKQKETISAAGNEDLFEQIVIDNNSNAATVLLSGANDYIRKPCGADELLLRVGNILKYKDFTKFSVAEEFEFRGWTLNVRTRELRNPSGQPVHLSPQEFALLQILVRKSREVVRYPELGFAVFGREIRKGDKGIHNLVKQIRKKIEIDDGDSPLIVSWHSVGYRFNEDSRFS